MGGPLRVAAAALWAVCLASETAWAQHVEGRVSVGVAGSMTETLSDSPNPTAVGGSLITSSILPSGALLFETPRTRHVAADSLSLSFPVVSDTLTHAPVFSNLFSYDIHSELSELTALTFSASASQIPANGLVVAQDASLTNISATPTSATYIIQAAGSGSLSHELTPTLTLSELAGVTYGYVIDPLLLHPRTTTGRGGLSLGRAFFRDTLTLSLMSSVAHFSAAEAAGSAVVMPYDTVSTTLSASWRHELSEWLTSMVTVGAIQILGDGPLGGTQYQPMASASLTYARSFASAVLMASHVQAVNVATGTDDVTDQVTLRASLPLGASGFLTTGSFGYTHAIPTTITPGPSAMSDVWLGDMMLSYTPPRFTQLTAGLRGLVMRQVFQEATEPSFTRWSLSASLTFSYPSAVSAQRRPELRPFVQGVPFDAVAAPAEPPPPDLSPPVGDPAASD